MHKALVIFLAAYFTVNLGVADWHYPNELPNGVLSDDEDWGGMCSSGKRQSPVDLAKDAAIKGEFPLFDFESYKSVMKNPLIVNNGHSIQISSVPGPIYISGGGLNSVYIFDQMHFHWSSEHTIDHKRFALELHIVHHDKRYDTLSRAAQEKNGIAVVGILYKITTIPNPFIEKLLENSKNIFDAAGKNVTFQDKLVLYDLLPRNKQRYFRYEGSLTTPSCGEAVIWTVFEDAIGITIEQLERFKSVHDDSGHELTHNYRHIQPLNSRALIYVEGEYNPNSANSFKSFSASILIISVIFAFIGMKI
ncbi:hypothetical protein PVAND_000237 [Polypedilum vanderplanki]|uniref:Carbonic anhydrase n=1 Tax=Polypedilum vanderplanki TaxID=319348 RepID=A0A9J6BJD4_POLVA|nr:hypothetical protein PVAND_000237 [Polypedilum vanderplanki]